MQSVRFVSPPGWPVAHEGEFPPDGWRPSADLPPAPVGWAFYVDGSGEPVDAPIGAWRPPQMAPRPLFQSPPGWPAALPGFVPPREWQPEASWPAPPEGWVYYRDQSGRPMEPPSDGWRPDVAPQLRRGRGRVLVVAATGFVVIAVALVAYFAVFRPASVVTIEQFSNLSKSGTLGGIPIDSPEVWDPSEYEPASDDPASCKSHHEFVEEHLLEMIYSSNATLSGYVQASLWDSAESARDALDRAEACLKDRDPEATTKKHFEQDGVVVFQHTSLYGVVVKNVSIERIHDGTYSESEVPAFVAAAVAEVEAAAR